MWLHMRAKIRKLIEATRTVTSSPEKPLERPATMIEPVYTIDEIAKREKLSREYVRKLFMSEPGVRKYGKTWRIPESVLLRVQSSVSV
jgi:hypothetical protein